MKKGKVVVAIFIIFVTIGVGMLTAQGQVESKEKPTLTVWMKKQFVEGQNQEFEKRVKEFAASKNVDVVLELIAYEDFFQNGLQQSNQKYFLTFASLDTKKWVNSIKVDS